MFVPIYRKDARKGTVDERRGALTGWTFSPLLQGDMVSRILESWDRQEGATLDLEIRDGLDSTSATRLFDSRPDTRCRRIRFSTRRASSTSAAACGPPEFDRTTATGIDYTSTWILLGGGLGLSALLFALLYSILNTRIRAQPDCRSADSRNSHSRVRVARQQEEAEHRARQRRLADLPQGHRGALPICKQAGARTVRHDQKSNSSARTTSSFSMLKRSPGSETTTVRFYSTANCCGSRRTS